MKDPWDGGIPGADTIQRYSHIDMEDGMDTIDGELKCGADLLHDILVTTRFWPNQELGRK
jgi:hypothetical protein